MAESLKIVLTGNSGPVDTTAQTQLAAHLADTSDAHDASAVSVSPAGSIAATDVQAALVELDTEKATTGSVASVSAAVSAHLADTENAHGAAAISVAPIAALGNPLTVQAALEAGPSQYVSGLGEAAIPAELGWPDAYEFTAALQQAAGGGRPFALVDITPESLYDIHSDARTEPEVEYWVHHTSGSDSNNGLSSGAAFKSIWKAIAAANAATSTALVHVAAGTYFRTNNPWYNGGSGVSPAYDIVFQAEGGRVITGSFDPPGALSFDGTFTNCQTLSVSSVDKVADMRNLTPDGFYSELTQVSTAAICNATPDSWAIVSSTLYINRKDRATVGNANTRVFRPATSCFKQTAFASVMFTGETAGDGWDFEGGDEYGAINHLVSSDPGANEYAFVCKNCTFRYSGGGTNTSSRGFSINSNPGIVALFNCDASATATDGFNFHDTYERGGMYVLTVNCTSTDVGRPSNQSCNAWTLHEGVVGVDIAGHYRRSHGGCVRNIDESKAYLFGTSANDLGDLCHGGAVPPSAFHTDHTSELWCDRTTPVMPAGGYAYRALDTSEIHRRNTAPSALATLGTVDTY